MGRLRLGIVLIFLLVLGSVVTGMVSLGSIQTSQDQLIRKSVPALATSELLERKLRDLLNFTDRVDRLSSLEELNASRSELTARAEQLNSIARSEAESGAFGKKNEYQIQIDVGVLVVVTEDLIDTSAAIIARTEDLTGVQQEISAHLDHIHNLIEQQILDANERIEMNGLNAGPGDIQRDISLLFVLTEMTLVLDVVVATITKSLSALEPVAGFQTIEQTKSALREITIRLPQLPDNPTRKELAKIVTELQGLTFKQDGIEDTYGDIVALHEVYRTKKERQVALTESISNVSRQIVARAKTDIETATDTATRQVSSSINLSLMTALSTFVVASLILYTVVEKQINRRMSTLTEAVRAIARGKTNHVVNVSGSDELAEMAGALEVFKENANNLRKSNEELERFAYVASHDLKSPLRAINDLAEWTLEDAGDLLPENCRENLVMLVARVGRLDTILSNLLEYARAGQDVDGHIQPRKIKIRPMIEDVFELLDARDRFDLTIDTDVEVVHSHEAPLRQVILNFFVNAMKHHDRDAGHIGFKLIETESHYIFSISDDGPGIEEKYQKRIFEMFQTLKSRDEVEGSGMGLSIVRKLVEHFGGSVWVESDPTVQRGSTFHFDWPKEKNARPVDAAA